MTDICPTNAQRSAAVHNLGCKVNAYEAEAMTASLENAGYHIVPFTEKADVYLINTCTVTNVADRKSRQMISRARHLNPDALIVASGCYVQTLDESGREDLSVDLLIGTNDKHRLIQLIEERLREKKKISCISDLTRGAQYEELGAHLPKNRCRAFLKIQDGCDRFCSYCAIPLARGRIRSRGKDEACIEARALAAAGIKEIVLTGIHLCSYAKDRQQDGEDHSMEELLDLIRRIASIDGIERIRLGSLEPGSLSEKVIAEFASIDKLCPQFHLSLQSGCDATLARMNRHYTTDEFKEVCALLRRYYDEPVLTTDVIVGFPGEDEEEFEATVRFLREIRFYRIHIFKYSRRDGTRAAKMPNQLTDRVKTERSRALALLNDQAREYYAGIFDGREEEVLLEEETDDGWIGHTASYLKVRVSGEGFEQNSLVPGRVGREIIIID